MIGSADLTIYGILEDGTKELVFKMVIGQISCYRTDEESKFIKR